MISGRRVEVVEEAGEDDVALDDELRQRLEKDLGVSDSAEIEFGFEHFKVECVGGLPPRV